jgi:hypothetical protein
VQPRLRTGVKWRKGSLAEDTSDEGFSQELGSDVLVFTSDACV